MVGAVIPYAKGGRDSGSGGPVVWKGPASDDGRFVDSIWLPGDSDIAL